MPVPQVEDVVLYEKRGQTAILTINRPERMNALGQVVTEGLAYGLMDFRNDDNLRTLILTGAGDRAFCAGGDLKEMAERHATGDSARPAAPTIPIFELLIETWKPVIAAVNGVAAGGGCDLAQCSDFRLGTPTARMGLPEALRGLGAMYGSVLLPRSIPRGIALQQMYTGQLLDATVAERWGLLNTIVPHADLLRHCLAIADQIAECAPLSIRRMKESSLKSQFMHPVEAFHLNVGPDVYSSEDRHEGARAFTEKRKAVGKGR
jgi:enoyl-CoA hydratase